MTDKPITGPRIAVQRNRTGGVIAIFVNGFECIRDFSPYTNEEAAVAEARAWLAERTTLAPELVYPRIDSIRTYGGDVRRRR